jgi:hypothetical protein
MNHVKNTARAIRAAAAAIDTRSASGRAFWSACAGAFVADAICLFLATVRHAALTAAAARAPRQPVAQVLISGWVATFLVTGIVTYAVITAVVHARRGRRVRVITGGIAPELP